jgi:hypothetical protein
MPGGIPAARFPAVGLSAILQLMLGVSPAQPGTYIIEA